MKAAHTTAMLILAASSCGVGGTGVVWAARPAARAGYSVEVKPFSVRPGETPLFNCTVSFHGHLPAPAAIDKIVRAELDKAVRAHPGNDVLATAFHNDDTLGDGKAYRGALVYSTATHSVQTMQEHRGVKTTLVTQQRYAVDVEHDHSDVNPRVRFLSITLVYPSRPSRRQAYTDLVQEIHKATNLHEDISAYVSVGNKNLHTSWRQMKDVDGAYVFAEYDTASGRITRGGGNLPSY